MRVPSFKEILSPAFDSPVRAVLEIGLHISNLQKYVDHLPAATDEISKRKRDGEQNPENGSKKIREETMNQSELESKTGNSQDVAERDARNAEKVQMTLHALQKEGHIVSAVTEQEKILEFSRMLHEAKMALNAVYFSTPANTIKTAALKTIQDMADRVRTIVNKRLKENKEKLEVIVKETRELFKTRLGDFPSLRARTVEDEQFVADVSEVQKHLTSAASDVDALEFFDVDVPKHVDAKKTIQNFIHRCSKFWPCGRQS